MFKALASFVQFLLNAFISAANLIALAFPSSPFQGLIRSNNAFTSLIAQINYFVPIYEIVAILQAWLIAVGVYYLVSVVARWVKMID